MASAWSGTTNTLLPRLYVHVWLNCFHLPFLFTLFKPRCCLLFLLFIHTMPQYLSDLHIFFICIPPSFYLQLNYIFLDCILNYTQQQKDCFTQRHFVAEKITAVFLFFLPMAIKEVCRLRRVNVAMLRTLTGSMASAHSPWPLCSSLMRSMS